MKKIITLLLITSILTACNLTGNDTPETIDYSCLDAQYIVEFESSGLVEHFNQFNSLYGERERTNRRFYQYMVDLDQFDTVREFYRLVDKEYTCLDPNDFRSLYVAYLFSIEEKR